MARILNSYFLVPGLPPFSPRNFTTESYFSAVAASSAVRPLVLAAERGSVFDREGADLALSVPQHTVWADPRLISDPQREADALAPVLGIDRDVLLRALTTPDKAFVYLAGFEHGLTPDTHMVDGPLSVGGWRAKRQGSSL